MFPITKAPTSPTEMLLSPVLLKFTEVPKSFPELLRSIALPPAETVVDPTTVIAPDWVTPAAVRTKLPLRLSPL